MGAMTNGETILNVLLRAVVEIRCACVLAPTQCRRTEENPAWVYTHRPENATLKPAQVRTLQRLRLFEKFTGGIQDIATKTSGYVKHRGMFFKEQNSVGGKFKRSLSCRR